MLLIAFFSTVLILNGAVLTCLEGIKNIEDNDPVIFNDCDHSFYCEEFNDYCNNGDYETLDGALLTFESNDPKYSFLELDENENVIRTVEKKAISNKEYVPKIVLKLQK